MRCVMAYYFVSSAVVMIILEAISPVNGQCTKQGCDNRDPLISIVAEIQQLRDDLFDALDKKVQSIHEHLNASLQEIKSQHHTVNMSLQAVDRRLLEQDVYVKQSQSLHELLLNASVQELKTTVLTGLQEVDRRRSQEHDIYIKQGKSNHDLFNESFQEMKSQHLSINMSLQAVDRRLLQQGICITQGQSIQKLINESAQQTKRQHDLIMTSLQNVSRRSQENNIYIKQVPIIHGLLNGSFQAIKSQYDFVNLSIQAVDRRLQSYQIDVRNQTQNSWKLLNGIYDVVSQERDCSDIKARRGYTANGVYVVCAGHPPNRVCANAYCDMKTNNSTSLVFQRRKDGSVNFNRTWAEYRNGFGNPDGEFWLGNEMLHLLTSKRNYKLRVDLEDFNGTKAYAEYARFSINSSADKYRLTVMGYSGNAGNSMYYNSGKQFSTIDADNDGWGGGSCAMHRSGGGWWYGWCSHAYLNGKYHQRHDTVQSQMGITWYHWKSSHTDSLKATEMKLVLVD